MSKTHRIIIIFSFMPLWILLLVGLGTTPLWVEALYQLIIGDLPEGNPDQLTYSSALVPLAMVLMGCIATYGLFNFLNGSAEKQSHTWCSNTAFSVYAVCGISPCVWLTLKDIPGSLGYFEPLFTLVIPLLFIVYAYKQRKELS